MKLLPFVIMGGNDTWPVKVMGITRGLSLFGGTFVRSPASSSAVVVVVVEPNLNSSNVRRCFIPF